jgi:tRNA (cmo5U34)-methyltransferase
VVDISSESLNACRDRLGDDSRFVYVHRDFRELDYPPATFDLVASSISVHHLTSAEKADLFRSVHHWLTPSGVFTFADQFRGATDDLYARHVQNWKRESLAAGASEDEFEMWMMHQRQYDHHDTLNDQLDWLSQAGFAIVDCTWRYLARKASAGHETARL